MATAVVNGKIVTESAVTEGTLILDEGVIRAFLSPQSDYRAMYPGCTVIDADGQFVVPGGVDGHVHFGGFGTIPIADDFVTGSRAALAGGTTTVVDFCEPAVGQDPIDCIRERKEMAKDSMVDFALHFTFTENYREELPRIDEILSEGITAFKGYTFYPNTSLLPGDFLRIMETIHDQGTLLVHAEEKSIIDCMKERYTGPRENMQALSLTRPNLSEQIAVETVLAIAKKTGTRLCIAHVSSGETAEIKARERAAGTRNFFLETCPHYLRFTRSDLEGEQGALYTMNPPLRGQEDTERLMQAILNEEISLLSTDHCPYSSRYKLGADYETVPCGVDGVQTRMPYLFSEGVLKRGLSMEAFVRLTSANPAKFYGLYPRKGTIQVGSDADLSFFDAKPAGTYSLDAVAGATDYSIFEGIPFSGKCTGTIKGGCLVMKDGKVLAESGGGSFLFTERKNLFREI